MGQVLIGPRDHCVPPLSHLLIQQVDGGLPNLIDNQGRLRRSYSVPGRNRHWSALDVKHVLLTAAAIVYMAMCRCLLPAAQRRRMAAKVVSDLDEPTCNRDVAVARKRESMLIQRRCRGELLTRRRLTSQCRYLLPLKYGSNFSPRRLSSAIAHFRATWLTRSTVLLLYARLSSRRDVLPLYPGHPRRMRLSNTPAAQPAEAPSPTHDSPVSAWTRT